MNTRNVSSRYFYSDGYGKDYNILNLPDNTANDARFSYLTACLLVFYQQKKLYADYRSGKEPCVDFYKYNLDNPLLIFVGSSVNAVRKENGHDVSDVVVILSFLREFLENRENKTVKVISAILTMGLDL
jgi:hypothetical protein